MFGFHSSILHCVPIPFTSHIHTQGSVSTTLAHNRHINLLLVNLNVQFIFSSSVRAIDTVYHIR